MKKTLLALPILVSLLLPGTAFAADCTAPEDPDIPDGAASSGADMHKAKKAIDDFMAAVDEFMECSRLSTNQHNRWVQKMHDVADEFNDSLGAYRDK